MCKLAHTATPKYTQKKNKYSYMGKIFRETGSLHVQSTLMGYSRIEILKLKRSHSINTIFYNKNNYIQQFKSSLKDVQNTSN